MCPPLPQPHYVFRRPAAAALHSEQQALLDFLVLARSQRFVGFAASSFSFYLREHRALQVVVGVGAQEGRSGTQGGCDGDDKAPLADLLCPALFGCRRACRAAPRRWWMPSPLTQTPSSTQPAPWCSTRLGPKYQNWTGI